MASGNRALLEIDASYGCSTNTSFDIDGEKTCWPKPREEWSLRSIGRC